MVTGVTAGYTKTLEIVGTGYRVAGAWQRPRSSRLGYSHPVLVARARRHHLPGRGAHAFRGRGHRQAEGRRGRREHPQAAQARPVQGQGRAVSPARSSAARPERRVSSDGRSSNPQEGSPVGGVSASRRVARSRRHFRLRKKVVGTAERPRAGSHPVLAASLRADRRRLHQHDPGLGVRPSQARREGDKTAKAKARANVAADRPKAAGISRLCSTGAAHLHRTDGCASPTPPARQASEFERASNVNDAITMEGNN